MLHACTVDLLFERSSEARDHLCPVYVACQQAFGRAGWGEGKATFLFLSLSSLFFRPRKGKARYGMGPPVPRIYRFARFLYNNVFYDYRDLLCPGYAFECRSVRMFCFGILQLCDLEFICFLYKVYDHLCARLWFLRFFYASFYFLFSVLLSLILFIRSLFLVLYI